MCSVVIYIHANFNDIHKTLPVNMNVWHMDGNPNTRVVLLDSLFCEGNEPKKKRPE